MIEKSPNSQKEQQNINYFGKGSIIISLIGNISQKRRDDNNMEKIDPLINIKHFNCKYILFENHYKNNPSNQNEYLQ